MKKPRLNHTSPLSIKLWDAINDVIAASGGSTSNTSVAKQKAVARTCRILEEIVEECCSSIENKGTSND